MANPPVERHGVRVDEHVPEPADPPELVLGQGLMLERPAVEGLFAAMLVRDVAEYLRDLVPDLRAASEQPLEPVTQAHPVTPVDERRRCGRRQ